MQSSDSFATHRDAALALLIHGKSLNWKSGSFLGQIAVVDRPLSEKQRNWLALLLSSDGLPPLVN